MPDQLHAGHRERIRARYIETGGEGFLDHQYLELLLTYAVPRRDTNELAHALLNHFGTLSDVFGAEVSELTCVDGVGESVALFLRMQGDLAKRLSLAKLRSASGKLKLNTPLSAATYAAASLRGYANETLLCVCLNSKREVVRTETMQHGTLTEARVYPRAFAETALLRHAHSVIMVHNHPSGDPTPSDEDRAATESVKTALSGIGVQLADHLVVGGAFVFSFSAGVLLDLAAEPPVTLTLDDYGAFYAAKKPALPCVMEAYPG